MVAGKSQRTSSRENALDLFHTLPVIRRGCWLPLQGLLVDTASNAGKAQRGIGCAKHGLNVGMQELVDQRLELHAAVVEA